METPEPTALLANLLTLALRLDGKGQYIKLENCFDGDGAGNRL